MPCEEKFSKLVYFDEGSIYDLLSSYIGGDVTEISTQQDVSDSATKGEVSSGGGVNLKFLNFFKFNANASIEKDYLRNQSERVSRILENTLLTDYISIRNDLKSGGIIKTFDASSVFFFPNSLSEIKAYSPYLSMLSGEINTDNNVKINPNSVDQSIKDGNGYYELLLKTELDSATKEVVLRFNGETFKNNYRLIDVTKMILTFDTIKVGCIKKSSLSVSTIFPEYQENNLSLVLSSGESSGNDEDFLEVYDVICAGVLF